MNRICIQRYVKFVVYATNFVVAINTIEFDLWRKSNSYLKDS